MTLLKFLVPCLLFLTSGCSEEESPAEKLAREKADADAYREELRKDSLKADDGFTWMLSKPMETELWCELMAKELNGKIPTVSVASTPSTLRHRMGEFYYPAGEGGAHRKTPMIKAAVWCFGGEEKRAIVEAAVRKVATQNERFTKPDDIADDGKWH